MTGRRRAHRRVAGPAVLLVAGAAVAFGVDRVTAPAPALRGEPANGERAGPGARGGRPGAVPRRCRARQPGADSVEREVPGARGQRPRRRRTVPVRVAPAVAARRGGPDRGAQHDHREPGGVLGRLRAPRRAPVRTHGAERAQRNRLRARGRGNGRGGRWAAPAAGRSRIRVQGAGMRLGRGRDGAARRNAGGPSIHRGSRPVHVGDVPPPCPG